MKRSTENPAVSVGWLDVWGKVAMKDKRKARGSLVLQQGDPAGSPPHCALLAVCPCASCP